MPLQPFGDESCQRRDCGFVLFGKLILDRQMHCSMQLGIRQLLLQPLVIFQNLINTSCPLKASPCRGFWSADGS